MSEAAVAFLLLEEPSMFMEACNDLESTDYYIFHAAELTLQYLILKAAHELVAKCNDCRTGYNAGEWLYCPIHADMVHETEIMLSDECDDPDKPVFQGTI